MTTITTIMKTFMFHIESLGKAALKVTCDLVQIHQMFNHTCNGRFNTPVTPTIKECIEKDAHESIWMSFEII